MINNSKVNLRLKDNRRKLSKLAHTWLIDTHSLTEKMSQLGDFSVHPIEKTEAYKFRPFLLRQVILKLDGKPWVYAETTLPKSKLDKTQQLYLRRLGNRSIGTFLLNKYRLNRIDFFIESLTPRNDKIKRLLKALPQAESQQQFWSRNACYLWNKTPIYITEIFLANSPIYSR